ncbi:MAG: hypothetical protein ACYCPQ_03005 [Elusimicrobiota bacterium]
MIRIGLLRFVFLAIPAIAAPGAASRPPAATNWLDLYSLSSYREEWTATIRVNQLESDLPVILSAFQSARAELLEPIQNFASSKTGHSQQLSYHLSKREAERVFSVLKNDGFFLIGLRKSSAPGNVPDDEVNRKIKILITERKSNRAVLSRMPAIAAVINQLIDRLVMVDEVSARAKPVVLLNVTVIGKN